MVEEVSLKFGLRKIDNTRNYLLDEIKYNDLMSDKQKKTHKCLTFVENLLIISSQLPGCVSISAFVSFFCLPVGITCSVIVTNICAVTARTNKYKSIIKKKTKKDNKKIL